MRNAQKSYFATRTQEALQASKMREADVDRELRLMGLAWQPDGGLLDQGLFEETR